VSSVDLSRFLLQETTLGAITSWLPWESELSDLAVGDPAFAAASAVVLDGDLDAGDLDLNLDNLYPRDHQHPLPFLLLVRGSVRARAVVNSDFDGGTHLVVLGDLDADYLITFDQETFVGGALRLRRAWWGIGEAGNLMVRGPISAPALIADGYRVDDERIRARHGVTNTAFLFRDGTDYLPRAHACCVIADKYVCDDDSFDDEQIPNGVVDWVEPFDVLDAVTGGQDPFAEPICDPTEDLFVPEPDLFGCSEAELRDRFSAEVSAESVVAVMAHPLVMGRCETYDHDLIDEDRRYSVRRASGETPARLTIVRVISDPHLMYRFHHFEARRSPCGTTSVELLTQKSAGARCEPEPVPEHRVDHYIDALSCFRRLREFLAESV